MVSTLRSLFQPADALVWVPHFHIGREKQFAQSILCLWQTMLCRLGEPVLCLLDVRDQQGPVPIELAQQVLGVGVSSFRQLLQLLRCAVPVCQRKGFVPDDLPQFPAIIGLAPQLLRLVVRG